MNQLVESFHVGQIVELKPDTAGPRKGIVYRVVKVNPKSLRVEDAKGALLTGDLWFFQPTDKPFESRKDKGEALYLGSIVTVAKPARGRWDYDPDQMFVVVKLKDTQVSIAKLGGEENKYYNVGEAALTVVSPDRIRMG